MWENPGSIPGLGRSPEEGMASHCSILAWRIPRTEEPGEQSMGVQRVGNNCAINTTIVTGSHSGGLTWSQALGFSALHNSFPLSDLFLISSTVWPHTEAISSTIWLQNTVIFFLDNRLCNSLFSYRLWWSKHVGEDQVSRNRGQAPSNRK